MIPLRQWLVDRHLCDGPMRADGGLALAALQIPSDPQAAIAEAHARGLAEGERAAQEFLQGASAAERARHEDDMKRAEDGWRDAALRRFTADVTGAFAALQDSLAEQIAAALAGFLEGGAKSKALLAFRAALEDLAETQPLIRIEGPPQLLEELHKLGPLPPGVETRPVDTNELRAVAGDTEIATALRSWLHAIHGDHA